MADRAVGNGRNRAQARALADQRARRAVEMRLTTGATYAQIGAELGISAQSAQEAYRRGCTLAMPKEEIAEARAAALHKYDLMEQEIWDILRANHPLVNWGRVVPDVFDDGPKLQAIKAFVAIEKRRADIQGYDAPKRKELTVISEGVVDAEIRRLEEELAAGALDDAE